MLEVYATCMDLRGLVDTGVLEPEERGLEQSLSGTEAAQTHDEWVIIE